MCSLEGRCVRGHELLELLGHAGRDAALVGHDPVDLHARHQLARWIADLALAAGGDPAVAEHSRADGHGGVGGDRPEHVELDRPHQPEQAPVRVPLATEPERRRVLPGDVGNPGQVDGRPDRLVRGRLLEADPVRSHDPIRQLVLEGGRRRDGRGMPRLGLARGPALHASFARASSSSRATSPVPPCSAVDRASRSSQERRASKTTSATVSVHVLIGGMCPGVVELVQDVGVDSAGAPLAVVDLGPGARLHRHVVGVDLGPHAVEQDAPLAADGRGAAGQEAGRQLLDDGAAVLAAGRLAAIGDLEARPREPGSAWSRRAGAASRPKSDGKIRRQVSGSVRSPFITARASQRSAAVPSASRAASAGHERIGLDPGVDDGSGVRGGVLEPHRSPRSRMRKGESSSGSGSCSGSGSSLRGLACRPVHVAADGQGDDVREGREPVDGPVRVRDRGDLGDRLIDRHDRFEIQLGVPLGQGLECPAGRRPRDRSRTATRPRSSRPGRPGLGTRRRHVR